MFSRVAAIVFNTYREAVRARILLGLFGLAVATAGYAIIVAAYTSRDAPRVISDVGGFSISFYGIVVAILLGATSLYRELELKTLFPILARPLPRVEYLVGKYLGALLTLLVFIAANTGILLLCLCFVVEDSLVKPLGTLLATALPMLAIALRWSRVRTWMPIVWGLLIVPVGWFVAQSAGDDRWVVLGSALLALFEVSLVMALATLFSSFSSPFLTAVFSFGVFLVGRSADSLAQLPARVFGEAIHDAGVFLSKVFPNLMLYVPPRPLLLGQSVESPLAQYLLLSGAHAVAWSVGLLAIASVLFGRRDFV